MHLFSSIPLHVRQEKWQGWQVPKIGSKNFPGAHVMQFSGNGPEQVTLMKITNKNRLTMINRNSDFRNCLLLD